MAVPTPHKILSEQARDGEVPSQKEISSYFEELLVVKFLVKRNFVPQMRNFSPTLEQAIPLTPLSAPLVQFDARNLVQTKSSEKGWGFHI